GADPDLDDTQALTRELAVSIPVQLCKYADRVPPCRDFYGDDLDLFSDQWSDGTSIREIGSLYVGPMQRATLCYGTSFAPTCRTETGGPAGRLINLGGAVTGSIEVKPDVPDWESEFDHTNQDEQGLRHVFPRDSELGAIESEEMQGVAHDPIG